MAEKYLDEIAEICLPAKLFHRSVGIAFDLGKYTYLLYDVNAHFNSNGVVIRLSV